MTYLKQFFLTLLVTVVGFVASATQVSANWGWGYCQDLKYTDYIQEFGVPQNPDQILHVEGRLIIDDASKHEVFAFLSDLENDPLIYPGTLNAVRTSGDGGVGTTYAETIIFGGVESDIIATILEYHQDRWLKFKADNLLQNVSAYKLRRKLHGKVELKLESYVEVPEGVTQQDMEGYLKLVFNNMLTQLGKTGQIEI